MVQRLSGLLEDALVSSNAELPYLNPNYAENTAAVASLGKSSFKESTRNARLTVKPSGPMVKEASVIYCEAPVADKKKKRRGSRSAVTAEFIPGMRLPATISADGSSVSAVIPSSIDGYCFMLIDENGFMQFSDVSTAK